MSNNFYSVVFPCADGFVGKPANDGDSVPTDASIVEFAFIYVCILLSDVCCLYMFEASKHN